MLELFALLSLCGAILLLIFLSWIDLKEGLLPNELVLGLAALSMVFHLSTLFYFDDIALILMGVLVGGGILYIMRIAANAFYGQDSLGLGDVKLMAAGGAWLGLEHILVAMTVGATAGFFHGLIVAGHTAVKTKKPLDLNRLSIPAGPGFAVGLIAAGILKFWTLPGLLSG